MLRTAASETKIAQPLRLLLGNLGMYLCLCKMAPKKMLMASAIYQLCQSMPGTAKGQAGTSRDKAGTNREKQGKAGTFPVRPWLSVLVPVFPCLSLLVLVCPCLSLSVPVCLYICYTFMSNPAEELNSLHQYEHSYIDFPCKRHCSNACKPCF